MTTSDSVRICLGEIRAKAAELRQEFGSEPLASALDWAVDRLEKALRGTQDEILGLAEASKRSGYSQDHLARLVRSGRIPDLRPPGSKGRICIRVSDLPARPAKVHTQGADVHELASRLLGGREGRHGHP
jgi:hypothetical protein